MKHKSILCWSGGKDSTASNDRRYIKGVTSG